MPTKKSASAKKPSVKKAATAKKASPARPSAKKPPPAKAAKAPAKKAKAAPAKPVAKKRAPTPAKKTPAPAKKGATAPAKKAPPTVAKKAPPTVAKKAAPAKRPAVAPVKAPAKQTAPPAPVAKKAPLPPPAAPPAKKPTPPAKKGGKLTDKWLLGQQELLHSERVRLLEQADNLKAEADQLAEEMEPGDIQFDEESGEGGTMNVERERDLALSAQARVEVEEIDDALAKIEIGTYGICERCGKPIAKERLKWVPQARLCVPCKSGGLLRR